MSLINQNLTKLLPQVIIDYILDLAGFYKWRNGKYMTQLDKTQDIFKLLKLVPRFEGWSVRLYVKTEWFRRRWCDKMISLYVIHNINNHHNYQIYYNDYDDFNDDNVDDNNNNNNNLTRVYDSSWYEYDECNGLHHIKTEEKILMHDL